jgi:hypothetical protein
MVGLLLSCRLAKPLLEIGCRVLELSGGMNRTWCME